MTTLEIVLQDGRDQLQSVDVARAGDGSFALTWSVLNYETVTVRHPMSNWPGVPPTITGDYVVSQDIYLQVFDADGLAPDTPQLLKRTSVTPTAHQGVAPSNADPSPSVSFSDDGGLTVAWSPVIASAGFVGPGNSIMVSSSGLESAADVNLEISLQDSRDQLQSVDVARAGDGSFALTWSVLNYETVTVRHPMSNWPGVPPTITGDYVVSQDIYLQVFDADGLAPDTPQLLKRTSVTPTAHQGVAPSNADPSPSVSFSDDGGLTVAWSPVIASAGFVGPGNSIMVRGRACADPAPFTLTVVGGTWADTDNDGDCDATGTILIGYKGGPTLLRVENAVAEYDENGLRVASGMVYSDIRQLNGALFEGGFDLNFDTRKVTVRDDADNDREHKLAAINYGIAGLTLTPRSIVVDIGPQLPEGLGGEVIGAGSFPDLTIGANGLVLDRTSLTLPFVFSVGEKWSVKSADLQFEYDGGQDKLKVEGEFDIAAPFEGIPTGRAYTVKTAEGKPFTYGPDGVEGRIQLTIQDLDFAKADGAKGTKFGKFGLSDIGAYIDFDSLEVGGTFNVSLPGFGKVANPALEASFGAVISPELKFNSFLLTLNGQVPLGPTGWFGQSVGIKGEYLAPDDGKAAQWSISGEVSYLPEFTLPLVGTKVGLLNISGTITGGADKWGASGQSKMLNLGSFSAVVNTGSIEYDVVKSTLTIAGTKSLMNDFIKTTDTFKVGFSPEFSLFASGKATISFPTNEIWGLKILSGKTLGGSNYSISFTDDGNFSNDFIAGWTNFSFPTFGSGGAIFKDFTFGRRYQFDDILSPQPIDSTDIGMLSGLRIAATSRVAFDGVAALAARSTGADFIVPPGAETVLVTATWQTPDPNAKLRLIAPY